MGQFDQTARPAVKLDGAAFFGWAFSCCTPRPKLSFQTWDDTRRLVCPGEPERTNDLVALCRDETAPSRPIWLVAEIEEEPEPGIFYRLGQYEMLLGKEVNATGDPAGPAVGALLLNLTGTQGQRRLAWSYGGISGSSVAPLVVDVAGQDAVATLTRIEAGEVGLTVLPFLALMQGGGTPEFIARWKQVAERDQNAGRCVQYREAAIVFAELTRYQVNWLRGMEGWMMRESQYIKGWERVGEERGEVRTLREAIVAVIEARLQNPVPEAIRLAIEGTNDPSVLRNWHRAAAVAGDLPALRRDMKLDP